MGNLSVAAEGECVILVGSCLEWLRRLPSDSVACCVTSPPYWGLRDYGVEGQLGLEPDIDDYITCLVNMFSEVHRVLRPDGTLWLNLGDSYQTTSGGGQQVRQTNTGAGLAPRRRSAQMTGIKPKDLIGIPWRVALALQADGWWLRSDVIWEKPNAMPSSAEDRPTCSHEYLFLLTKSQHYYYDRHAILEPFADSRQGCDDSKRPSERNRGGRKDGFTKPNSIDPSGNGGRNKRSVWRIPTRPFKGAHFATFPPDLVTPCILAGTSERGYCEICGSPWKRQIERTGHINQREPAHVPGNTATKVDSTGWAPVSRLTDTWLPTCACPVNNPVPGVVLDPFAGSGTVGMVARDLGRLSLLIELNPEYAAMARDRVYSDFVSMP